MLRVSSVTVPSCYNACVPRNLLKDTHRETDHRGFW